jgi:hypothetical protein
MMRLLRTLQCRQTSSGFSDDRAWSELLGLAQQAHRMS